MLENIKIKGLILFLTIIPVFHVYSQLLNNPSVESDSTGAFAPVGWVSCNDWSDPDIGIEHFGIYPVDGSKLALMRSRGVNYIGRHPIGSVEYMSNRLNSPLEKGACYRFTIYICYVKDASIGDSKEPDISYPLKFQVWGISDSCGNTDSGEKLIESQDAIRNQSLELYTFNFHVKYNNYKYFLIKPAFDTLFRKETYNGIILVDHMNLTKLEFSNPPSQTIEFSSKDLPVQLHAANGIAWDWDPKENLSAYDVQSPYLNGFTSHYKVTVTNEYGCTAYQDIQIIHLCDSVEPFDEFDVVDTTINYGDEIVLESKYGLTEGSWFPLEGLDLSGMNPVAKPMQSTKYYGKIYTEFQGLKCYHIETFYIRLNYKIPNVITPGDGSGPNDLFRIPGLPEGSAIKIFDKNGNIIFEASPYDSSNWWNGDDLSGNPVKTGTYWYGLEIPGEVKPETGFIFVVRK